MDAFLFTLTAAMTEDNTPATSTTYWNDCLAYWNRYPMNNIKQGFARTHTFTVGDELRCRDALLDVCVGRCLFLTKNSYIGLVPAFVEPGNKIVLLFGSSALFALRHDEFRN